MRYLIFISEIYDYNKYNENSCVSEQCKKNRRSICCVCLFIYGKPNKRRHVYYAIFSKSLQCSLIYFCYFMDLRLSTIDIINTMHTQCNQHNDVDSFLCVIINMLLRINKVINIIRNQLSSATNLFMFLFYNKIYFQIRLRAFLILCFIN